MSEGAYVPLLETNSISESLNILKRNSPALTCSLHSDASSSQISSSSNAQYCEDCLFSIVQSHYTRGVRHRQYISLCIEVINVIKYCYGEALVEAELKSWISVLRALLKLLLPITMAYEMLQSGSTSNNGSLSTGSYLDEEQCEIALYRPRAYSISDIAAVEGSYHGNSEPNSPKNCSKGKSKYCAAKC